MPDWRENVLPLENNIGCEHPIQSLVGSYPRRNNRIRPNTTCPYTTIFVGQQYTTTDADYNYIETLPIVEADALSVDRSSNLTETSSFAHYEDRRLLKRSLTPEYRLDRDDKRMCRSDARLDTNTSLQIHKVNIAPQLFYVSAESRVVPRTVPNVYIMDAATDDDESDIISSCTCDSFERCEFDCREFEPFSDTCCCDPNGDGFCTRSPKEIDSPLGEDICDDKVSIRSDMDGLDLALFEPASGDVTARVNDNVAETQPTNRNEVLCGILHSTLGDAVTVPIKCPAQQPTWEPYYCVLQQDRRIFTAYTSEELAGNSNDFTTRSLPRVRLDGGGTVGSGAGGVRLRCWAAPPSITEEEAENDDGEETDTTSLQAMPLGDTSYEKACRRGSAPNTPSSPNGGPLHSPSRLASFFFSKRSFRSNPLKRTKSATKLERERAALNASQNGNNSLHALRTSRSHESLLSAHSPAVSTMDLGAPHQVDIRALHASVLGRPHCFALSVESRSPRYFACASRKERDRWIYSLRQAARSDELKNRRFERSVKLWLLEAKNIPPKKRYYCEILFDDTLYARSSTKLKSELCFWGEVYEFSSLPAIKSICVNIYREPDRKARKRDKHFLVGSVRIPVDDVASRYLNERWYPIVNEKSNNEKNSPNASQASINGTNRTHNGTTRSQNSSNNGTQNPTPSLRVKCRYQCTDILPLEAYGEFLDYLKKNYRKICEYLEPVIGVKAKEDIGGALVLCMAAVGLAPKYLADVVALDVRRTGDHSLTFRGNSLATKSMEAYLKLVGDQYLQETLCDSVAAAATGECEVDPSKVTGGSTMLRKHQAALRDSIELTWRRIAASSRTFPLQLRDCFATFRERLSSMGREDIIDNLISASIFLRFLCPAILSPSLFGIIHEYPNERAARNLTLVAKTLQTLANFTRFQGKEAFMEFLNDFLEREAHRMKAFLREISTRLPEQESHMNKRNSATSHDSKSNDYEGRLRSPEVEAEWAPHIDLGKQLAVLHSLLADTIAKLPPNKIQELEPLCNILDDLTNKMNTNESSQAIPHTDNIFRVIDPTCNASKQTNDSQQASNLHINTSFAHSSPIMSKSGIQFNVTPADETKFRNNYSPTKSPSVNNRSATLPRNGYNGLTNPNVNPDRYSTQYNNNEHCVNLKVIQIGFDQYGKGINSNDNNERKYKPSYGQSHYHNNTNYSKERSPSSDSVNHNYSPDNMQALIRDTANLEELSDLLKYAEEAEESDKITSNNLQHSHSNNNIVNGAKNYQSNGSNVSISGLSNIASSGYQSFATYSQSSSPIENTNHHYDNNVQPLSRYSQLNYQKQRDKQYYDKNKNEKFYTKNPLQQKIEYDIQKYGIQNFTTDNGQSNNNNTSSVGPLVFTNPVYSMENDKKSSQARNKNQEKRSSRCACSSSSSDEEGMTSDHMETNSDDGLTNFKDTTRQLKASEHRKLTRDACQYDSKNNQDMKTRYKFEDDSSNPPSLRKTSKTRMPRTNPMLSYSSSNHNHVNLKHFGQRGDSLYENKPHHINTDNGYPMIRSDSNVEEVNKEMYRLQISRSQKALYNVDNTKTSPEKFGVEKTETNYPLEKAYSSGKMSSSRLNEDIDNGRHQDIYYCLREHDSPIKYSLDSPSIGSEKSSLNKDKLQRRLSLESARELTDSSSDMEDIHYSTTGRRRQNKHTRTIEQYEREIERLKGSIEILRSRLGENEAAHIALRDLNGSNKMNIEEELRRSQRKMSIALSQKQRVIEAQEHRIAALDEANTRLLSALVQLHGGNGNTPHVSHGTHPPPQTRTAHDELQI